MAERKDFDSFFIECGGVVRGYGLRDGQVIPETYDELLSFMGDRLSIDELPMSVGALTRWLMRAGQNSESCSPTLDTIHAEAVVLIGELPDPDSYVAQLPDLGESVVLPPSDAVRRLIRGTN